MTGKYHHDFEVSKDFLRHKINATNWTSLALNSCVLKKVKIKATE